MTTPPPAAPAILAPLPRLKADAIRGVPVGGLWRLNGSQIEIQHFGSTWMRVPREQLQRGPQNLLVWKRKLVLAPAN